MARKDDDRARRLAAALRENLKRRKAQGRARPSEKESAGSTDSSEDGQGTG